MRAQKATKQIQLMQWMAQVKDCTESGMTVRQWCAEHGMLTKTYYYRRNRVREELLDGIEIESPHQLLKLIGDAAPHMAADKRGQPVFAELPMPRQAKPGLSDGAAVTVRIGGCAVDIRNGADCTVVEWVLKAVSQL